MCPRLASNLMCLSLRNLKFLISVHAEITDLQDCTWLMWYWGSNIEFCAFWAGIFPTMISGPWAESLYPDYISVFSEVS